jgi:DNA-binding transcriptional ArsR family regulator
LHRSTGLQVDHSTAEKSPEQQLIRKTLDAFQRRGVEVRELALCACRNGSVWKSVGMASETPTTVGTVSPWDTDELLVLLSDPLRRQIICSLAAGPKPASETSSAGRNRHVYHRHFTRLRKAGIIIRKEKAKDRRKPLYYLDPRIAIGRADGILTVNFGRGQMRIQN